jgi:hypothetical protein
MAAGEKILRQATCYNSGMSLAKRSRRRWLMRVLFVFVAVSACVSGYVYKEWRLVQARKVVVDWLYAQEDVDAWEAPFMTLHDPPPAFSALTSAADWHAIKVREGDKTAYPDVLRRRFFGDHDIAILSLGPTKRPDYCSCEAIKALFPETTIYSLRQDDRAGMDSD